jgi:CHAT domain-containing protein
LKALIAEASRAKDYNKELYYFQQSYPIYVESFGAEHYNIATLYSNIGSSYNNLGQYSKALDYRKKALELSEKVLQKNSLELATNYNNMGISYQVLGSHKKALVFFEKSLKIREKVEGTEAIYVAQLYSAIGRSYGELRNVSNALSYHEKAIKIYERTLGKEHLETSHAYNNLGGLYLGTAQYQKAVQYFQQATDIREKKLDKFDTLLIQSYANLAEVYKRLNNYDKALPYLHKIAKISKQIQGIGQRVLADNYESLGWTYFAKKDYVKAYDYAKQAFNIFLEERKSYFPLLSAVEKEHYLKKTETNIFLLVESAYLSSDKKNFATILNDRLRYKGSIFDSENMISTLYAQTQDSAIKAKINQRNSSKRELAKLYQMKANDVNSIKVLEDEISKLTKELTQYATVESLDEITYHDIAKNLKEHELYIDFARIAENYFVFTIDKNENISFTFLDVMKTKNINQGIISFRNAIKRGRKPSHENLATLYALLMKNFVEDNSFKEKTDFIVSADGILNLFPFETLINPNNSQFLIENRNIRYVPSGKELVRLYRANHTQASNDVVIFDNPDFDKKETTKNRDARLISSSLQKMVFSKLPGTKAEAEAIKKILINENVIEYTGVLASEENLFSIVQPKILHIATHGFFIKKALSNPMLKSGLALTGANNGDGVLTALKLSGLNLKGTKLVVLSACETGLMNVNSSDSVSGLSKAFIQAGAKNIVVSLWSVSDMGTKDLMILFYEEIHKGISYSQALKNAKLNMIKNGVPVFIWSPFILNGI